MTPHLLKTLNDQLRADLGRNPHGEAMYKWAMCHELTTVIEVNGELQSVPVSDRKQWVLAYWMPPGWDGKRAMTEEQWNHVFKGTAAYQREGSYHPTDMRLKPGAEPSDGATQRAIQTVKAWRNAKPQDISDFYADAQEKERAAAASKRESIYREGCFTPGHIPGKRGGPVVYGGIE